ncbi:haloacid dehalogenase-like hydrolase, putative [Hepatocystis sp. ex Piliocolobus tephrosceles]|nr:haloacid dehalogenase-like hydrolase, putative [Hepatocystis sp. ex Piliocolobus tephrosceles]
MQEETRCYYLTEKGKSKNFKNIKLITFDLDHTIWNIEALLNYADNACYKYLKVNYKNTYDYLLKKYDLSFTNVVKKLLKNHVISQEGDVKVLTRIRIDALKYLAKKTNCDEQKFVTDIQELWHKKKNNVHLFISPGTLEYLKELKQRGYILGAITNGDSDAKKIKFLNEIFSFVIRSVDYEFAKPNVKIFDLAENFLKDKNINLQLDEWLHVGDDIYTDIMGAKNKNINCAWITMFRDGKEILKNEWYSYLKLKFENNKNSDSDICSIDSANSTHYDNISNDNISESNSSTCSTFNDISSKDTNNSRTTDTSNCSNINNEGNNRRLKHHNPYADAIFSKLRETNVVLPYDYIDIEIRHCSDLDVILV